jgi:DNA-binding NarL/FixJ family response regulator
VVGQPQWYEIAMDTKIKARVAALTPRQREVVRLISLGCTVKEAAGVLDLAPNTVDNHRTRAMKVLDVDRATLLTRVAIKYGVSGLNDKLSAAEERNRSRKRRATKKKKAVRKRK